MQRGTNVSSLLALSLWAASAAGCSLVGNVGPSQGDDRSTGGLQIPQIETPDWEDADRQLLATQSWTYVSVDEKLQWMRDELRALSRPADRRRVRFIDLTHLNNALFSADQLAVYRQALSHLLNSLSLGLQVASPEDVDPASTMLRIDLDDLGWTEGTWATLVANYPYAVRFNPDSQLFPFNEPLAQQIREETGSDVPCVHADWLLAHAARPPLYYELLEVPDSVDALAASLGVDLQDSIASGQAKRAAMLTSPVAVNSRIIERHEQPGGRGPLWIAYDFRDNVGASNIFEHPLDFQPDGIQVMFSLPNGMLGFMMADGNGQRMGKATPDLLIDPLADDLSVEVGVGCMGGCHYANGYIPANDVLRDFALTGPVGAEQREQIAALHPEPEDFAALVRADRERFLDSRSRLGTSYDESDTVRRAVAAFDAPLSLVRVAGTLGISEDELAQALNASPTAFPAPVRTLRNGGAIARDAFDAAYADIVRAVGLGEPLRR